MSGFAFDAKAALASIAARSAGGAGAVIRAVVAVDGRATVQEPQEPQVGKLRGDAPMLARWPQEPREPRRAAIPPDEMVVAIAERAALAAACVPAVYLDAWARLQFQRPLSIPQEQWQRAVNDGGLFLDAWGEQAAELSWTADELFDVPDDGRRGGLVWLIEGDPIEAFGEDHARTNGGRSFERTAMKGGA